MSAVSKLQKLYFGKVLVTETKESIVAVDNTKAFQVVAPNPRRIHLALTEATPITTSFVYAFDPALLPASGAEYNESDELVFDWLADGELVTAALFAYGTVGAGNIYVRETFLVAVSDDD